MSPLRKFLAGSDTRITRFHDELGQPVPLGRALRNGPRALGGGLLRLTLGHRPELPWISYDAQAELARFLTPASRVIEFGSGISTIWYARRAGYVVSIENDRAWYEAIGARLGKFGNVDYRFAADRTAYLSAAPDQEFDLVMIDGNWREDGSRYAIGHLRPGGIIYLDNSDQGSSPDTGDVPAARKQLLEFAARHGLPAREFTDFAPTQLHVQRGLMVGGPTGSARS
jgi:predicted O-methyltransferase YrrM